MRRFFILVAVLPLAACLTPAADPAPGIPSADFRPEWTQPKDPTPAAAPPAGAVEIDPARAEELRAEVAQIDRDLTPILRELNPRAAQYWNADPMTLWAALDQIERKFSAILAELNERDASPRVSALNDELDRIFIRLDAALEKIQRAVRKG